MDPVAKKKLKKSYAKRNFDNCIFIYKKYFDKSTIDSDCASIIGISYLFKFEFDKAKDFLEIAINIDSSNVNAIIAYAALNLKQKKMDVATEYYLKVLEIDENNKIAHKILSELKRSPNIDKLIREMKFKDYLQMPPYSFPILSIVTLGMVILVIILLIIILVTSII